MKKIILSIAIVFAFSTNVFAQSSSYIANKCLESGKQKIIEQAAAHGCNIDVDQITVQSIDNRWYNPSKYVWYRILTKCTDIEAITILVQYFSGKCY